MLITQIIIKGVHQMARNKPIPKPEDMLYRNFNNFEIREDGDELLIEGYAATFEETVLFEHEGVEYKEIIDRNAFTTADMSDVIFNYNHGGKVIARTRNKTLDLRVDNGGLYINAKVGGTDEGRRIYEEVKGGYIDRMSFAFKVSEDSYDRDTHTRKIIGIKKVWDVSAVDIPAYDSTSISARGYFDTEEEKLRKELESDSLKRKKLLLILDTIE